MKHIAGPWVCPDHDLVIQRCVACGFALINARVSCLAVPEGSPRELETWESGTIVDVTEDEGLQYFSNCGHVENTHVKDIEGLCIQERF